MTGFLVRSTATNWAKGSVLALDAGTHLAAVTNIINQHLPRATTRSPPQSNDVLHQSLFSPSAERRSMSLNEPNGDAGRKRNGRKNSSEPYTNLVDGPRSQLVLTTGPFAGFELPHLTAKANAAYFVRNLITTYLITHPHLDHISGFVINTAGFQHTSRPKRLAGLPSTINAFKTHIFNDSIWPNLSDEDGGVGLVSYMRLAEGGNLAIGEGEGRGYIEVCDGLAVKGLSVSHGKCMHNHSKRSSGSGHNLEQFNDSFSRRASQSAMTPNSMQHGRDHTSFSVGPCITDSSAFFLRDDHTGSEVLIFGDVEPDSLSLSPRTAQVWADAAPKVASGLLRGILIECSYDESQSDDTLFGHLAPRHVIAELLVLADKVNAHRNNHTETSLKRKRMSNGMTIHDDSSPQTRKPRAAQQSRGKSRKSIPSPIGITSEGSHGTYAAVEDKSRIPNSIHEIPIGPLMALGGPGRSLDGLQVIIIHVKDSLKDNPDTGETILSQLQEWEKEVNLGCSFAVSQAGTSIWL